MQEIQSLSICCPSPNGCINHCKTCTALQYDHIYKNKYDSPCKTDHIEYWSDVKKRMRYALSKGCTTLILTGSNEPQQNFKWLETLYNVIQSLPDPFLNIEIQTTGAFIDEDYLKFLKGIGVTTLAVSTFNIFDDKKNREIIGCQSEKLCIQELCDKANEIGLNIRICINVTDQCFVPSIDSHNSELFTLPADQKLKDMAHSILHRCYRLHANQVTFRKMWSFPKTEQAKWIDKNTKHSDEFIQYIHYEVQEHGTLINYLPYGAGRYDYNGFSIVIDLDCMAKDTTNTNTRYYIIRENGKMYSSWDSKASLVF